MWFAFFNFSKSSVIGHKSHHSPLKAKRSTLSPLTTTSRQQSSIHQQYVWHWNICRSTKGRIGYQR